MQIAKKLRVFSLNIAISNQVSDNLERIMKLLTSLDKELTNQSAILLPEMFTYMGSYAQLPAVANFAQEVALPRLSVFAKERQVTLFAGSVPELPSLDEINQGYDAKKVFNTAFVIDATGKVIQKYRKIHLFNLRGKDPSKRYCESDGFHAGKEVCTFILEGWRVALGICYDLRFPDLFAKFHESTHPDVIFLPAAFTHYTGSYHWELLLRARAVENQCYIVASNQMGTTSEGKAYWGHAMIVDPWGNLLQDAGAKEGFIHAVIEKEVVENVRAELPALENRVSFFS